MRDLTPADLAAVRRILPESLVDPGTDVVLTHEVDDRMALITEALSRPTPRSYFVATVPEAGPVGIAGLQSNDISPELFGPSERPVEVITVYVRRSHRGLGVGSALLDEAEGRAASLGFTTLLVVSGSRNRESGYPFWQRRYGAATRYDESYFGPGAERAVWRHTLSAKSG